MNRNLAQQDFSQEPSSQVPTLYAFLWNFQSDLQPPISVDNQYKRRLLLKNSNLNLKEEVRSILGKKMPEKEALNLCLEFWRNATFERLIFSKLVELLDSSDRFLQYFATIGIRKLFSTVDAPMGILIKSGVIPKLLSFIEQTEEPDLQLEAAWILANVTSGTTSETRVIVDRGLHRFVKLLRSDHEIIQEQVIWLFGNTSGDSAHFRDVILKAGAFELLLRIVDSTKNQKMIKHGTWAISNLCRGKPLPDLKYVICAIPTFVWILEKESDVEIIQDALWALNYLTEKGQFDMNQLTDKGLERLSSFLNSNVELTIPSAKILGHIVKAFPEESIKLTRDPEFIPKIYSLLHHQRGSVRRDVLYLVSGFTRSWEYGKQFFELPGFIECCMNLVLSQRSADSLGGAVILFDFVKFGDLPHVTTLYKNGILNSFLHLISKEKRQALTGLRGLYSLLKRAGKIKKDDQKLREICISSIKDCGSLERIFQLCDSKDEKIKLEAYSIIKKFFVKEKAQNEN